MRLVILSGRSGSGKTTALRALEDAGFYCIDNFPIALLNSLVQEARQAPDEYEQNIAVCIDARSHALGSFTTSLASIDPRQVDCQVVYLDAQSASLVKRFSETRRRHPLTSATIDLLEAIETEHQLLEQIAAHADLTLDTTLLGGRELGELIVDRLVGDRHQQGADAADAPTGMRRRGLSLLFRSFGFKFGVPVDADLVFDLRCLPNPHWVPELKPLTGRDAPVVAYLDGNALVQEMATDLTRFLERWLPRFESDRRTYLTVAIGCTGGQHRSVYMVEKLATHFGGRFADVLIRHRELPG